MYRVILIIAVLLTAQTVFAQTNNELKLKVQNKETKEAVADAQVSIIDTDLTAVTDSAGTAVIENVPNGKFVVEVSSLGYEPSQTDVEFPLANAGELIIYLTINNEVGEVTISSTRTGRDIEAEPSRVEAIDEEEIDEKISMRPGNISMVLHESTGIQVQQTSATSNTQSIRIQGLDGRYTQLLKDGFPAYGGFSGSLSVLEIPPLDLKQVEVIKGPAATLYGGDAIAGVVNFITKDPGDEPVTTLIFNQTSALGTDISGFNSRKFSMVGYTLHASANYQKEYDVDDDNFTELPNTKAFGVAPKVLFYIDDRTNLVIGNSTSYQNRIGGDTFVIRGNEDILHQYFERNATFRSITTLNFNRSFDNGGGLNIKQSIAIFKRDLTTSIYRFKGSQFNSYTEVSYAQKLGKNSLVFGGTAVYDQFSEDTADEVRIPRDETRTTFGVYIQDTIDLTDEFAAQVGLRVDQTADYGTFVLPRISLLYRFTDALSARVGFGLGYKTPTIFNEDSERLLFQGVQPIGDTLKAERSRGGTFDINYRGKITNAGEYSINQMFFYTMISDPIILQPTFPTFTFINERSPVISRGFETNARFSYGIAKLFFGYTFTDAKAGYLPGTRTVTLLPKNKINSAFVFEKHDNFKAGVEFYYASPQVLEDRSRTRSLAEFGLFGEKTFGKFSLFINAENLTDVRQSRYGTVVFPPYQNPTFAEIYTHTEGRIFNGGIKIRL